MSGRRYGKSRAAEMAKEAALDAGKRVLVVTSDSMTLHRREKHMTLIENIPKKEPGPLVIYDDYYL